MNIEINMIVSNAQEAAEYYAKLFSANVVLKTDLTKEMNEAIITIGNTSIRILNENSDFGLIAPKEESLRFMWINLIVDDIHSLCSIAEHNDCHLISPITEHKEANAINAVLRDKYNHMWVINQRM